MSSILLIPLAIYTSFVFGINNSGLPAGSLLASGFSYKKGIALTGVGFLAGALLEGWKMGGTLEGLTGATSTLSVLIITLIVTGIIFSIFSFLGFPISLVNVLIGSYLGASLAIGLSLNYTYMNVLLISWVALPFVAAIATIGAYKVTVRLLKNVSPVGMATFHLISVPLIVFYTAYTLGANNIGLLYHLSVPAEQMMQFLFLTLLPIASFFGVMKSRKTSIFVSEGVVGHSPLTIFSSLLVGAILVWIFTQVSLPVSLSQVLIGGLIGVNLYRKPRAYNKNALIKLVASWVGVTLVSFFAALVLQALLA
ncbi:MAG: inorganic phosphate transporter [Nitrososphaerales archaeon]